MTVSSSTPLPLKCCKTAPCFSSKRSEPTYKAACEEDAVRLTSSGDLRQSAVSSLMTSAVDWQLLIPLEDKP